MNKEKSAEQFARKMGYDKAVFQVEWGIYSVFSAINNDWDSETPPHVGLPLFILVGDSVEARAANESEWSSFAPLLSE